MTKISLKLFAASIVLISGCVAMAGTGDDQVTLKQISNYRDWIRINQQAVVLPADSLLT